MRDRLIIATVLAVVALIGVNRMTGDAARPVVYVVTIDGTIDLGLAPFLARTSHHASTLECISAPPGETVTASAR